MHENDQLWPEAPDLAWESGKGRAASSATASLRQLRHCFTSVPFPSPGRMEPAPPLIPALMLLADL